MPSCASTKSCKPCRPATKCAPKKKSTVKRSTQKKVSSKSKAKICTGRCGTCCSKADFSKTKKAPSVKRKKPVCYDGNCGGSSSDSSHSSDCSCSDCYSGSDSESSSDSDGGCYQGRNSKGGCCK